MYVSQCPELSTVEGLQGAGPSRGRATERAVTCECGDRGRERRGTHTRRTRGLHGPARSGHGKSAYCYNMIASRCSAAIDHGRRGASSCCVNGSFRRFSDANDAKDVPVMPQAITLRSRSCIMATPHCTLNTDANRPWLHALGSSTITRTRLPSAHVSTSWSPKETFAGTSVVAFEPNAG